MGGFRQARASLYPWNFCGYHTFPGLSVVSDFFFAASNAISGVDVVFGLSLDH